jgi:hypothetical protein
MMVMMKNEKEKFLDTDFTDYADYTDEQFYCAFGPRKKSKSVKSVKSP